MNNHPDNLTPILIGFKLPKSILPAIIDLNQKLELIQINFRNCLPHVTLWMGFIPSKQIESLSLGLEKIFKNVEINIDLGTLGVFQSKFGSVLSLELILNRELYLLQNRVHHFFEPFREIAESCDGFDQATVDYVNGFSNKSLDNYTPHITIGFGAKVPEIYMPNTIKLIDPMMFRVGNYCTCESLVQ